MDVTSPTLDPITAFSSSAPAAVPAAADSPSSHTKGSTPQAFEDHGIPDVPCEKCQMNSYLCKKIREGKYKGYCTSCVALRCECSFGLAAVTRFPYNPWPTLGDHPDAIPDDICITQAPKPTAAEASNDAATADGNNESGASTKDLNSSIGAAPGPKVGARFSRESVKILKNWLSTHNRHPYPNEEEKEMLQKQTGLNKTQITNWLANARRRNKIAAPRSTSPGVRAWTTSAAIDIPPASHMAAPHRRGTPVPALEHMNPLQRWQVSPPEHEPASVTDIARAVSSSTLSRSSHSPGLNSPFSMNFTDDGSAHSLYNASTASSINTSHSSGGSFASAFSHGSKASLGSFGSMQQNHRGRRRRRRRAPPTTGSPVGGVGGKTSLAAPLKTYMCTFCTETFRTKHDWQRHEKSLHLSLERWVCCPDGPRAFNPETGQVSCVFCGCANPDEDHLEKQHNHGACQERTLEERTFYRKDHLRQHLKLVHGGAKFAGWAMEAWKVSTPEIRSRCGFCGIVMDTWTIRVDHLAEHFKGGNTMADWVGDWGFDTPVLQMVENSMPPYLIHDERQTPLPYKASQGSPESPRNAYELLKSELDYYRLTHWERAQCAPTDDEMRVEACRIVFGAEVLSHQGMSAVPSWLRDLLVADADVARRARMAPIRSPADSRQARLAINGKDNIFENDPMERELLEYVKARELLGLTAMDTELQIEACKILSRMEESSARPSDDVANFLLRLIHGSPKWLADFRQRACLPRSEDVADEAKRSRDPTTIDSTIHNYSRLEAELAEYVRNQRSMGMEPTDADLQKQARIIIYEFDDGWNQTAADNVDWLSAFKRRHVDAQSSAEALASKEPLTIASATAGSSGLPPGIDPVSHMPVGIDPASHMSLGIDPVSHMLPLGVDSVAHVGGPRLGSRNPAESGGAAAGTKAGPVKLGAWFLNDANCYRRLARELGRWVNASMSPNNPNCHVPSDEEIQHQARWILYDSDDPWNQTAADNAEWLRRFKRETGILTDPSLPGLPEGVAWNITQGGTGFAPPYAFPNPSAGAPTIAAMAAPSAVPFDADKWGSINVCSTDGLVPSANTGTSSSIQGPSNNATGATGTGMLASATPEVTFPAEPATANKWLAAFGTRGLAPPATVFCSRELENGLAAFVAEEMADRGVMPGDEELQARARDILGTQTTAADDVVLLEKFKGMMRGRLGLNSRDGTQEQQVAGMTVGEAGSGSGKTHTAEQQQQQHGLMDIDLSGLDGTDLTDIILQDMEFDFDFGDVVDLSPLDGEN